MFIRIKYLREKVINSAPQVDSYVMPTVVDFIDTITQITKFGFQRGDARSDPDELIMPGAILSITPCDERGYSAWDLQRIREQAGGSVVLPQRRG